MPFSSHACFRELGVYKGRLRYELVQPLHFFVSKAGRKESPDDRSFDGIAVSVLVPVGFVTDLASTPRFLWSIFPPAGPWIRAAILHDYLYSLSDCSRFLADALFREAMHDLGVPCWRRVVMYYAVRLFGGFCKSKGKERCGFRL